MNKGPQQSVIQVCFYASVHTSVSVTVKYRLSCGFLLILCAPCDFAVQTDKTQEWANTVASVPFVCLSIQQHALGSPSQIFAQPGLCRQSSLRVFIERCVLSHL